MSISSEITRLTQAKTDIKTAIENKGVTVPSSAKLDDYPDYIDDIEQGSTPNLQSKSVSITENGTTTVEPDPGYDGLSEVGVSVNVQGGGGGGASEEDDVRFIDYDGTLLYSYSASDFLSLTEMPENPTHEGLTSQGWNWTLADAKTQVTEMGTCDIGQMYITDDGKTRIYIELPFGRLSPCLGVAVNGKIEIDWGDDSEASVLSGTSLSSSYSIQHDYATDGNYIITLTPLSGKFSFIGTGGGTKLLSKTTTGSVSYEDNVYANCIKKIYVGESVTSFSNYSFCNCRSLESITIPKAVTTIGDYAFRTCTSIKSITIPNGITYIEDYAFQTCYSLCCISIPLNITIIYSYAFQYCYSLSRFCFPCRLSEIGQYTFQYCYLLESVKLPSRIKILNPYAFGTCYALKNISLPSALITIGNNAFQNCNCLGSVAIPNTVKTIGNYAFSNCYSLSQISISEGISNIGTETFYSNRSLSSITIPANVTSIWKDAFYNCNGAKEYHFLSTTPPSLSNNNVFYGIPSDCLIYVPLESVDAYKTANIWSNLADKIVGE